MDNFVYILYSKKLDKHYIGFTQNLTQRIEFHLNDTQSRKFTYKANDWELIFTIECESKNQGLSIEKHIKAMKSKIYIRNLLQYPEMKFNLLEKYKDASDFQSESR
ncbi:GIY-YIG nuclease family protein [Flavobacterium supellecticarium]|uniref:GIY-YIG nuclease family protein n=1 Tax=Flavobacterium supellecticarium TaxID=2565924 RepID=A0A4S3ZRJ2_9FLAO|nr:GIY-YIG nuclease family protein [Flavobacterium supellecticarium]THF48191.1 GIY-YIG nuclease family protein [Flavobacterium supellecticarium]